MSLAVTVYLLCILVSSSLQHMELHVRIECEWFLGDLPHQFEEQGALLYLRLDLCTLSAVWGPTTEVYETPWQCSWWMNNAPLSASPSPNTQRQGCLIYANPPITITPCSSHREKSYITYMKPKGARHFSRQIYRMNSILIFWSR